MSRSPPTAPSIVLRLSRSWRGRLRLLCALACPTWGFAAWRKSGRTREMRTRLIRRMNGVYVIAASLMVVVFLVRSGNVAAVLRQQLTQVPTALLAWFLLSRATEVFCAFYRDAFDRLDPNEPPTSALDWADRVRLALRSYGELVLDFAILFALLPESSWVGSVAPKRLTDLLSYSATTITTSGGGGFTVAGPIGQFLTAYEIACGLILLVVSFAIYAGRSAPAPAIRNERPRRNETEPADRAKRTRRRTDGADQLSSRAGHTKVGEQRSRDDPARSTRNHCGELRPTPPAAIAVTVAVEDFELGPAVYRVTGKMPSARPPRADARLEAAAQLRGRALPKASTPTALNASSTSCTLTATISGR